MPISEVLRYGPCVARGSHSSTCHPHANYICLYSPAASGHCALAGTHCTYPQRDGQAELTWVAGYVPGIEPGYSHPSQYIPVDVVSHHFVCMNSSWQCVKLFLKKKLCTVFLTLNVHSWSIGSKWGKEKVLLEVKRQCVHFKGDD